MNCPSTQTDNLQPLKAEAPRGLRTGCKGYMGRLRIIWMSENYLDGRTHRRKVMHMFANA